MPSSHLSRGRSAPILTGIGAEQRVDLAIAGMAFAFVTSIDAVAVALRLVFADFLSDPAVTPTVLSVVEPGERSEEDRATPELVVDEDSIRATTYNLTAVVDRAAGVAHIKTGLTESDDVHALTFVLENYLRMIFSVSILDRDGVLLHSAGVIREGKGYVFSGHSEAGKSTSAAFSYELGYTVLSDDLNLLLLRDGRVYLHGVPFRGGACPVPTTSGTAPIERLVYLRQDSRDFLEPISVPLAASLLTEQVPFVSFQPATVDRVLDLCYHIAHLQPMHILHLRRSPAFWQIL
jgi:hypothetical protein